MVYSLATTDVIRQRLGTYVTFISHFGALFLSFPPFFLFFFHLYFFLLISLLLSLFLFLFLHFFSVCLSVFLSFFLSTFLFLLVSFSFSVIFFHFILFSCLVFSFSSLLFSSLFLLSFSLLFSSLLFFSFLFSFSSGNLKACEHVSNVLSKHCTDSALVSSWAFKAIVALSQLESNKIKFQTTGKYVRKLINRVIECGRKRFHFIFHFFL